MRDPIRDRVRDAGVIRRLWTVFTGQVTLAKGVVRCGR